jgi:hypothetical protein
VLWKDKEGKEGKGNPIARVRSSAGRIFAKPVANLNCFCVKVSLKSLSGK